MEFNEMKKVRGLMFVLALLMALGLLFSGCESDSVAPNDDPPALTELEVVQQAALVAMGITKVGPQLLNFDGSKSADEELGVYPYSFPGSGDITGSIILEYFTGGAPPAGVHSNWVDANYGLLYTRAGTLLEVGLDLGGGLEVGFGLTFNLHGDINRAADTATVSGSGTIAFGSTASNFTITEEDAVVLHGISGYPSGGMLMFSAGAIDVLVVYDGDRTAGVVIDEIVSYMIDLDTGIVTPI